MDNNPETIDPPGTLHLLLSYVKMALGPHSAPKKWKHKNLHYELNRGSKTEVLTKPWIHYTPIKQFISP